MVRQEVTARLVTDDVTTETNPLKAKEAIDLAAKRGVEVVRQHRSGIDRLRKIAEKLASQLDADSDDIEEIEAAIEEETAGDTSAASKAGAIKRVKADSVEIEYSGQASSGALDAAYGSTVYGRRFLALMRRNAPRALVV